jgi:hypothetical protein
MLRRATELNELIDDANVKGDSKNVVLFMQERRSLDKAIWEVTDKNNVGLLLGE